MKRFSILLLAGMIIFAACNNKKPKEVTVVSEDGKEKVTVDANQAPNVAADMQKQAEALQKLPTLSLDQVKALFPATLMGSKQSNYSATSMAGASYGHADYRANDSTNISVVVYDCAGTAGAGIYSAQYMTMMNFQQEDDAKYSKTIDFMGGRAIEQCQKATVDCSLTYFTGGRFLVILEGRNVGADGLKQAAKELDLK